MRAWRDYRVVLRPAVAAMLAAAAMTSGAEAGPFSGGVVVQRMGGDANFGGSATPPAATATPIFLDEFDLNSGLRAQTIPLPASDPDGDGPQRRALDNGSSTQVGYLSRSADGNFLVTGGYDVAPGATLPGDAPTNNRIFARLDALGIIDTSTGYSTDGLAANNATLRSVATPNGTTFYGGTANGTAGTRYVDTFGTIDSSTDGIGGPAVRTVGIFGGRFFVSSNGMTSIKDAATGGLPVGPASGNSIATLTNISNTNSEQFALLDLVPNVGYDGTGLDTLYLTNANDISATTVNPTSSTENTGGLQKYTFDGTNFNLQITYNSGLSGTNTNPLFGGLLGLTFAGVDANGNPILYATTDAPATTGNALVRIVDAGPSSAFTLVSNAPTNTLFRGVALAPIPEPGGVAILGLGALGLIGRRRAR